ncbi:MAG: hypothetical protein N2V78_05190 [Methanophagales archaeon]|nr:hypothetical protein [Methanophagales archaeon]
MNFFEPATNLLRIFFICLILLLFVSAVCAQVHIHSICYNSEAMVTENVMTNNADYSSVTVLLPYSGYAGLPFSIRSDGAGKSVDEEFSEFSHRIFAGNCEKFENIAASLKTESESGGFEWKGGAIVSSYGLAMGMSVDGKIENGTLDASYGNSLSKHTEAVTANGAQYSVATSITPATISSEGTGEGGGGLKEIEKENVSENNGAPEEKQDDKEGYSSYSAGEKGRESDDESANEGSGSDKQKKEKDEGDTGTNENQGENVASSSDSGFSHKTRIESQGKWAGIMTNLTCDTANTSYEWKKSAITTAKNSSLAVSVEGESNNESLKTIEMDGEASKFPHLHLPPGEIVITTVVPEQETDQPENNQANISEAATEFYEDFSENPTALFYSIEQECFVPRGGKEYSPPTYDIAAEGEYFKLNMHFIIGQEENGAG